MLLNFRKQNAIGYVLESKRGFAARANVAVRVTLRFDDVFHGLFLGNHLGLGPFIDGHAGTHPVSTQEGRVPIRTRGRDRRYAV